jgi:hypothetical protein
MLLTTSSAFGTVRGILVALPPPYGAVHEVSQLQRGSFTKAAALQTRQPR